MANVVMLSITHRIGVKVYFQVFSDLYYCTFIEDSTDDMMQCSETKTVGLASQITTIDELTLTLQSG